MKKPEPARPAQYTSLIEQYRNAFLQHQNSPASVLCPKGRQDIRYASLTSSLRDNSFSVLDYGCGLGHLKSYLDRKFTNYTYVGADIVPEFIAECRKNFPDSTFLHIKDHHDILEKYDHVVLSGVFNIDYFSNPQKHREFVFNVLEYLFQCTRVSLSCDFMSDRVDFVQDGAFHLNEAELIRFVQERMSTRFRLDHSYMPYEFSLSIFKDHRVIRPSNVYYSLEDESLKT